MKKLLKIVVHFVSGFFALKKYSRRFIKLKLNRCSHMDYFNNVFTNFLCLKVAKNILICFLKMNKGLTGLELDDGE